MPEPNLANKVLTDGTGVSALTASKFVKDLVVDFLIGFTASVGSIELFSIPTDGTGQSALILGAANALFKAVYRALLRWASN